MTTEDESALISELKETFERCSSHWDVRKYKRFSALLPVQEPVKFWLPEEDFSPSGPRVAEFTYQTGFLNGGSAWRVIGYVKGSGKEYVVAMGNGQINAAKDA